MQYFLKRKKKSLKRWNSMIEKEKTNKMREKDQSEKREWKKSEKKSSLDLKEVDKRFKNEIICIQTLFEQVRTSLTCKLENH